MEKHEKNGPKSLFIWGLTGILLLGVSILFALRLVGAPEKSALRGWDNTFYFLWLRSGLNDGDFDFADDIALTNTLSEGDNGTGRLQVEGLQETDAGRVPNKYGIGWAVMSVPFYIVASALVFILNSAGLSLDHSGFGLVHQVGLQMGNLVYSGLACWFCYRIYRRRFSPSAAQAATLVLIVTTPALYYLGANLSMSHHLVFLFVAWMIDAVQRFQLFGKTSAWMEIGFLMGMLVITRYQMVLIGLYPAVVAWQCYREKRLRFQHLFIAGFVFGALVMLQLAAWKIVYGNWFVNAYGEQHQDLFHWFQPAIWQVLFSANHGLLYWHPFLTIILVGFGGFLIIRGTLEERTFGIIFLGTLYINASVFSWNFGSSFGHRGFVGLLPMVGFGAAFVFDRIGSKMLKLILALSVVAALWNLHLAIVYSTGLIDRNGSVTWLEAASAMGILYQNILRL